MYVIRSSFLSFLAVPSRKRGQIFLIFLSRHLNVYLPVCVCVHVRWRWHTTEFAFRLINFRYLVHEGGVARWMIRTNDTKSSSSPNDEKISNYLQLLRQNLRTICTLIGFHRAQGNNRWPARCTFARSERGRSGRARGSEFN